MNLSRLRALMNVNLNNKSPVSSNERHQKKENFLPRLRDDCTDDELAHGEVVGPVDHGGGHGVLLDHGEQDHGGDKQLARRDRRADFSSFLRTSNRK